MTATPGVSVSASDPAYTALAHVVGQPVATAPWGELLSAARSQRLEGVLWRMIVDGTRPGDELEMRAAKDALRDRVVLKVRLYRLLLAVRDALEARSVPTVVLKGPAAAALDHAEPHDRLFVDLDVLVRSRHMDAAVEAVQELGGIRYHPQIRPGYDARFAKSVTLHLPEQGLEVDIHRTLTPEPFGFMIDEDTLFAELQRVVIGRHPFLTLGPTARLMHASYHSVLGGDDRVVPLLDARLLLDRVGWTDLIDLATRWRARAVVATAVRRMEDRLGLPATHEAVRWADRYRPGRREAYVLDRLLEQTPSQGARALLTLPYLHSWRDRAEYVAGLAWPSPEFLAAKGTSRRAWLQRGRRRVSARLGIRG